MEEYHVEIVDDFYIDLDAIIERKEEFGTYQSNIDKFKQEVNAIIH